MISKIRGSDNRITELEAYVILAVTGQDILQADNLTTALYKKKAKKCTHIFILGNYIYGNQHNH